MSTAYSECVPPTDNAVGAPRTEVPPAARAPRRELTTRETAVLVALIAFYVELIVALALVGKFTFIAKTSIIPALIIVALLTGRVSVFVNDWAVFLSSVLLFDCFRGLVYSVTLRFDLPIHAAYVVRWDERLLGGQPLSVLLQRRFFASQVIGPFEKVLTIIHGSHFLFFLFVGMAVWLFRRDQFWRFRRAFMLLMLVGLAAYLIVPTVPPWMAAKMHIIPPIRHITAEIYNLTVPTLQSTFDTNPVAAMPSLHTAFPTLCSLIALHHFGRRALALPFYTLLMYFAIAYMGEHYLIDIFMGVVVASSVYVVVYRSAWGRAPSPARGDERAASRRPWIRQAILALVIIGVAEGAGQLGQNLRRPLFFNPTFVDNDMRGRSDKVHLTLGRYALSRNDYDGAQKELRLALGELRDLADRSRTADLLTRMPHAVPDGDQLP
ncbi:MAG TPA: phosphatase PAP2 family protein [Polyangia bacterium]|jgi:hypothetical protein